MPTANTTGPHEPAHVRVVIRTHEKELLLLRSLIYGLRAQREAAAKWLGLDFVLVPTEPGAQETYRRLSEGPSVHGSVDLMPIRTRMHVW